MAKKEWADNCQKL